MWQVQWDMGKVGSIKINGTEYFLQQAHWHSPSEHTINGNNFDLELHAVHESLAGQIIVVGIMYRIGDPDPFLASVKIIIY